MVRNQHDQALHLHAQRIVSAVMDAADATYTQVQESGALIRYRDHATADGPVITVVEVVHRFVLPALDEDALAAALDLRITRSDDLVLRLER